MFLHFPTNVAILTWTYSFSQLLYPFYQEEFSILLSDLYNQQFHAISIFLSIWRYIFDIFKDIDFLNCWKWLPIAGYLAKPSVFVDYYQRVEGHRKCKAFCLKFDWMLWFGVAYFSFHYQLAIYPTEMSSELRTVHQVCIND